MSKYTQDMPKSIYGQSTNPFWAEFIYNNIKEEGYSEDFLKKVVGKSLLERHVNPFFEKMLPKKIGLDVRKKQFKYSPHEGFDVTLGKNKLGFNWRW